MKEKLMFLEQRANKLHVLESTFRLLDEGYSFTSAKTFVDEYGSLCNLMGLSSILKG